MVFDLDMIKEVYARYPERIAAARKAVDKPLTLAEKILYTHLWDGPATTAHERGNSYVNFDPDRVAMQVYANPEQYFDQVIEINLSELTPHLNGPFTPDLATPVAEMKEAAKANDWPTDIEWALIGSCTNSSYEDLTRAASIVEDAISKGVSPKSILGINPGSEQVRFTAERDGLLDTFKKFDSVRIFTNACGPCIGQWDREGADKEEKNSIVHSFNRNFAKRADGNPNTHAFVTSPEMVAAIALAGRLDFNPISDTLTNESGEEVKLKEPSGIGAKLLIKAFGKCTTDHISMAGPWLRYRGHLDNISNNCLIGAVNAFGKETNSVVNQLTGEREDDTFNFTDLNEFAAGKQLTLEVVHADGSKDELKLNHTYNEQQIDWFRAGSALNLIKRQNA